MLGGTEKSYMFPYYKLINVLSKRHNRYDDYIETISGMFMSPIG